MTRDTTGLALGPRVQSRRAEIRRQIQAGRVDVPGLLDGTTPVGDDVEQDAIGMTVADLVGAVPGVDVGALGRILDGRCTARTRLYETTTRARRALADSLRCEIRGSSPRTTETNGKESP